MDLTREIKQRMKTYRELKARGEDIDTRIKRNVANERQCDSYNDDEYDDDDIEM